MKKVGVMLIVLLLFSMAFSVKIGITQIVDHPALNKIYDGIVDYLNESGVKFEVDHQSAQNNFQNAIAIANKFKTDVDIIVAIATPSAQAAATTIKDKPVVFSAVTDPISAGLIPKWGKNPGNVVGISDMVPVETHVNLMRTIFPEAKNLAILYNPGEANSVFLAQETKRIAPALNFKVIEITGTTVNELVTSLNANANRIDIAYLYTDNLVASSAEILGQIFDKLGIPVIAGDIDIAKNTSVIGFGFNYYQVGIETGKIVLDLINGKKPSEIESRIVGANALTFYINLDRAKKLNVKVPQEFIDIADEVVGSL
ncbi:ABC transporter substrate-binding protein [Petrotoga sp. 9PWA.NaAc.5.4]|uniref:ABC transporter substrate-binding protein n=1 Tax=Petrotoga sp. 9PWA.NaAc.5.4 TaxID=1434328 RepID=UPI000CAD4B32|nr:ABC transporter substrate-binding protein [Petrotoga sp. 9PWA.NaAc.5.4]PNR96703.1 ABC transporter substrate-binding protein [Petrotoga sp. 9PWA.NaAc.5.4]